MLRHSGQFPWLSLCLYKPLLCSKFADLALRVALHLQSLSQHLCSQAKNALLTLVFVPILHSYAGSAWDVAPNLASERKTSIADDVIFIVLGMTLQFIEESLVCRMLFVRHSGLKALNRLLGGRESESCTTDNAGLTPLLLDMFRLLSTNTLQKLSNSATISLFKPASNMQPEKLTSAEPVTIQTGTVRSFFRGISFSWGSDKRRAKDCGEQVRDSVSTQATNSFAMSAHALQVDEVSAYVTELKKFVQTSLHLTGASSHDPFKEKLKKTISFVRAVSGADSTDSEADFNLGGKMKRKLSETSGYRSTSLEHLDPSHDRGSASNHSVNSSVFSTENIHLPGEVEVFKWKKLSDSWRVLGHAVPARGEMSSIFLDMNGFNIALKLLGLIATGLSSYFDSEIDFTLTTIDQSFNDSFAKSVNSSAENLCNFARVENKTFPTRLNSMPKISPLKKNSLKKTASLDDILSDSSTKSTLFQAPVDSAIDTPESVIDIEIQQRVLEDKLALFASCLKICFHCAKLKDRVIF